MSEGNDLDEFRRQWRSELFSHCSDTNVENGGGNKRLKNVTETSTNTKHKRKCPLLESNNESCIMKLKCLKEDNSPLNSAASQVTISKQCQYLTKKVENGTHSAKERFLDIFLSDLNEINEIPFFDLEIPREIAIQIFHHLDMQCLCRCAQVSKAWKSLAEDELLWFNICQQLGYEQASQTVDHQNWKEMVKQAVSMEYMLIYNWKNSLGLVEELSYIPGGVLTAAYSFQDWVIAGYTSSEAKLWNLETESECVLHPSSTALVPRDDESFAINSITQVIGNNKYSAALFSSGMVDVWDNDSKTTSPVYTFQVVSEQCKLRCSSQKPAVALSYGSCVRVDALTDDTSNGQHSWQNIETLSYGDVQVSDFLLLSNTNFDNCKDHLTVVAMSDHVKLHRVCEEQNSITELFHTAFQSVEILDNRGNELAISIYKHDSLYSHLTSNDLYNYQVQLYNLETCKEIIKLPPQDAKINTLNIRDSPQNMVVTAGYRNVRLYDTRLCDCILTVSGHNDVINQVQIDDWKIVSGGRDGFVCVWDQRMANNKLWDIHNRHPVQYLHFKKNFLLAANIPSSYRDFFVEQSHDNMLHKRYQGSITIKDFSVSQQRSELPSVCQSTFDEPERYNYNVRLTVPYDSL